VTQDHPALDELFTRFDRMDGPGIVVGVARHGQTVYRRAFGMANVEHRVAMTPTTRVSICSVTKHMTCAAVLVLADEGKLTLDDTIGHWIPELTRETGRATLRQLMDHTGGVRCHIDVAAFNGVTPHPVGTPLRMMQRQQGLNFAPGEGMMYCNGSYALLSLAVERAAGVEFGQFLRERLFAPLRMDASESPRTWWPLRPNVATYYMPHPEGGWRHGISFEEETLGNGSALSSLDDMLRWAQHLRTNTGPVSIASLTPPPEPVAGLRAGVYRYGLTDQSWRGTRIIEHGGGAVGASCHLLMIPDAALDVFVFCNSIEPAQQLARDAAALVLGDELRPGPDLQPVRCSAYPQLLRTFFDPVQGMLIGFGDLGDDRLGLSMLDGPIVPALVSHEPLEDELPFHVPTAVGPRYFRIANNGTVQWLDGPVWRDLQPIELQPVESESMIARLGEGCFVSDEAGATVRFRIQETGLVMESCGEFGRWDFHCRALRQDMLAFGFYPGAASWLARLKRGADGSVQALEMSGSRTRGLVFHGRDR
jgi:CubicO group peptidase (beta-lactamase class C family)